MRIPSREYIEHLREKHPEGSRVQLVSLNDPYSKLTPGECGVLRLIDDLGTYHVDWDSGSRLGLVPGEDGFNILPPETTTLKLYMPMTFEQYERNQWGDYEGESVEIPAYAAAQYENIIHEAILRDRMSVDTKRGLMEYYSKLDSVNFKVKSYVFDVEERDGVLWGVAECEVYGELTDEELSKLKESISSQAADGFGEGFEQREIRTEDGSIYAHLWNGGDDWSVSTEEELFGQTQDKSEVMDMQMS